MKTCSKPCSPSDWREGGKCHLNGCFEPHSEKEIITGITVTADEHGSTAVATKKKIYEFSVYCGRISGHEITLDCSNGEYVKLKLSDFNDVWKFYSKFFKVTFQEISEEEFK